MAEREGTARSTTEEGRERASREFQTSEELVRRLAEHALDVFWISTPGIGKIFYVNPAYETIWGRTRESLYAEPKSFIEAAHPEDRERLEAEAARHAKGVWDIRYRIVRPDGQERWIDDRGFPIRDATGRLLRMCGVARDVTERRRHEEAALQTQAEYIGRQRRRNEQVEAELDGVRKELLRRTRLAAIGQLSASIAHDLRNPLAAIRNAAYYLKRRLSKTETKLTEFLDIIEEEVRTATQTITNLLAMSRQRQPSKQPTDLGRVVRAVAASSHCPDGVTCRVVTDPHPFHVMADPDQLRQLLVNLLTNAVQAMRGSGEVIVEARRQGHNDIIVVRDSGPGLAPAIRDTLFDPLVTTKAKGTGLGLAICQRIVEGHGGAIEALDHEGGGAAFQIRLPCNSA